MEIIERVTLRDVELSRPEKIFYGANTMWWTHDPEHLSLTPEPTEESIRRLAGQFQLKAAGEKGGCRPVEDFIETARRLTPKHRLPCDPRGGMLFETDNVKGFLAAARNSRDYYGRHGLRAFMAAHHLNSVRSLEDPRPWCETSWDAYNDALDRLDARKSMPGATVTTPEGASAFAGVDRGVVQPVVANGGIQEFFIVALDRATGEQIGGPPTERGTAHFKANLPPLGFVLSYVREVVPDTFVRDLARDLARAFVADVYGRPEGGGEWALLARGEEFVIQGRMPS